ncbi:hypothetical protein GCM10029976_064090 [Kribbella albertanoniae]|uniref:Uncharacterized protein n=1 Tax=Kribbella albertanoniae TaxID=1266829 RepID=A0A4R4Q7X6_9ACTN|nr:PQQ-binding-like beta-propeller repeat protein [Kribbella albertanoniae]TDC31062.1 hypothetical protein E1261_11885 [Kribbella albertanoniae]
MQRPTAKAVATAAALLILVAGCGGKDDNKGSDAPKGGGDTPTTPAPPPVASFDPPKGLTPVAAYGVPIENGKSEDSTLSAGMVGQTALVAGKSGLTGRHIAGQRDPWTVLATEKTDTITVADHSEVMPVELDGKDVAVIAYSQIDKGNGTQKAKGQLVIQWIDAADGKKVAEVTTDFTAKFGPGTTAGDVSSQAYDPATGQVAIGLHANSSDGGKNGSSDFTVFADPKTQKATITPFIAPAAVLNGTVVGAKGRNQEGAHDGTIVVFDGASGKVSKQIPTKMDYLTPEGSGTKHAYFNGSAYVPNPKSTVYTYNSGLYAVDIATGALVGQIKTTLGTEKAYTYTCLGDQATAVVCTTGENGGTDEIIGIDDATGKKVWGYNKNSASRVVPVITGAFHGVAYGHAQEQPVMLDAKTGADIPQPSTNPSTTPSVSSTPTDGTSETPTTGVPTDDVGSKFGSDLSQFNPKLGTPSPTAINEYGATYLQNDKADNYDIDKILIAMKPTA